VSQSFSHFIRIATAKARSARHGRALLFVASLPVFMGTGAALVAAADSPVVSQAHRRFIPAEMTIKAGTVVHFVNDDNVTHHVYVNSPEMQFDSGEEPVGKAVDVTFVKPGVFTVLCAIHPTMHLKVTVQ
jgi:plastocyanin